MAVATIVDGTVAQWRTEDVGWDVLHGQGTGGSHHARVVAFLRHNAVTLGVAGHMGDPMVHTLTKLGVRVVLGASGDARAAVLAAI